MGRPHHAAGPGRRGSARTTPPVAIGEESLTASDSRSRSAAIVVVLVGLIAFAFAPSFAGRFVFDDVNEIVTNPAFVTLPPWRAMFVGKTLPARPLPYLTFAIDHRLHGDRTTGYHAVNLAIHATAALALFDLVRTTLRSPRLRERVGDRADMLAGAVAMIWAVHPLQTQAVTYIYQRIESMAGMFVLLSLAAFARAWVAGPRPRMAAAAVMAAAAAMASKESAVVLPFLAGAYDRCFLDPGGWRVRRPWHAALCTTWLVLVANVWIERGEFQELEPGNATPLAYLVTQGGVILHYLQLAVWPAHQCIDYRWPIAADWLAAAPCCLVVLAGLAAATVGLAARRPWSFPAMLFFLTLAPTSSLLPVAAAAAEHRMYLPLAGVVVLAVLTVDALLRRRHAGREPRNAGDAGVEPAAANRVAIAGAMLAVLVIVALCLRTRERNRIYAEPQRLWAEAVARNPRNATAQARLAEVIFAETGNIEQALPHAEAAAAADPGSEVFRNLSLACKRPEQAPLQERLSRREWQLDVTAFGSDSREALEAVGRVITILRNRGDPQGADLAAEHLPAMRRVLGQDHLTTLATSVVAAQGALGRGDPATAEQFAHGSWRVLARSSDRPPQLLRLAATALAESLRRLDRGPEAEQVLRATLAELSRAGGHADMPAVAEALADILAAGGDRAAALDIYRQLLTAADAARADDAGRRLAEKLRTVPPPDVEAIAPVPLDIENAGR